MEVDELKEENASQLRLGKRRGRSARKERTTRRIKMPLIASTWAEHKRQRVRGSSWRAWSWRKRGRRKPLGQN